MQPFSSRAGRTVPQGTGYLAFVPADLPPDPPLAFDAELIRLLSDADLALGRLGGVAALLPNPDLFVAMYVRKEAVLSSQIEGIQCTLDEVLQVETGEDLGVRSKDVGEVVNYVDAMNYGINRLPELPLSLRLLREIHTRLMDGVRGEHKAPGEFRRTQNWIGPQGSTLSNATFVPPPVPEMTVALERLERFMHDRDSLPLTVQCALIHAQFETIHPFLDGNGRLGRLLVPLLLQERGALQRPLLYISLFLKRNRHEYYDRLMDVRQRGNWEGWVKFFLVGMATVAHEAAQTAQEIVLFREKVLADARAFGRHEVGLVDQLFQHPIIDARAAEKALGCAFTTAQGALQNLEKAGHLSETTGKKRGRVYRFDTYVSLFEQDMQQRPAGDVGAIDEAPATAA